VPTTRRGTTGTIATIMPGTTTGDITTTMGTTTGTITTGRITPRDAPTGTRGSRARPGSFAFRAIYSSAGPIPLRRAHSAAWVRSVTPIR
jgi:hypothetical protein